MNALRLRMIDEMNLAGLAASTQQTYLGAVDKLAVHGVSYFRRTLH